MTRPIKATHVFKRVEGQDFSGYDAALKWCRDHWHSVGSMEAGSPTGVVKGSHGICKWSHMTQGDREALDGTITGDFRSGDVTLTLYEKAGATA